MDIRETIPNKWEMMTAFFPYNRGVLDRGFCHWCFYFSHYKMRTKLPMLKDHHEHRDFQSTYESMNMY